MSKYGTVLIADDNTSILTAMRYLLDGTFERILTLGEHTVVIDATQSLVLGLGLVDTLILKMNHRAQI